MKTIILLTQIAIIFSTGVSYAFKDSKTLLVDKELVWKPTTKLGELANLTFEQLKTSKIKIEQFKDARTITPLTRVGENKEDDGKGFFPVETKSNISEFVTSHFSNTLLDIGANITQEKSDYVLSGEIKEYFVTEKDTYQTTLTLHLVLKKSGKRVWDGVIFGTNTRFGRSYKLENYMESLSDVIIDSCNKLLSANDFRKSFQTKTGKN